MPLALTCLGQGKEPSSTVFLPPVAYYQPSFLTFLQREGGLHHLLLQGWLEARLKLPLCPGALLQFSEQEDPTSCWDYSLDLPATYRAPGRVPEDPPGTAAAELCVAAGDKAGVDSIVEADDTLLSCCGWERGRHK